MKEVKIQNAETMQSYFTRVSQIKEQLEAVSEEYISGDGHLEWPPKIMGFIHVRNVCQKEVITFSRLWKSTHKKKISTLEEPLIHISISIRNDVVMNEEDNEAERRSLPMKQIKISIQLSFHDIVFYAFFYIQLMYYA